MSPLFRVQRGAAIFILSRYHAAGANIAIAALLMLALPVRRSLSAIFMLAILITPCIAVSPVFRDAACRFASADARGNA